MMQFLLAPFNSIYSRSNSLNESQVDHDTFITSIPDDIWVIITGYLSSDMKNLFALSTLCKSMNAVMKKKGTINRLHIKLATPSSKNYSRPFPDKDWFSRFPCLESFGLHLSSAIPCPLNISNISSLPRSLKHLVLGFSDSITDDMLEHLPPHLLTLNLNQNSRITNKGIPKLPQSLTSLSLENNYVLTTHMYENLPRGLQSLFIRVNGPFTEFESRSLPPALTSLSLVTTSPSTKDALSALPKTLKILDIRLQKIQSDTILALPQGLVDLKCSLHPDSNPDMALRHVPRGLIRLHMYAHRITSQGIAHLPSSLRDLELSTSQSPDSSQWILNLPINLERLSLPNLLIMPSDLPNLPYKIRTLILTRTDTLKNSSFSHLPPKLEHLALLWTDAPNHLTKDCLKYAPPTLKRLELRCHITYSGAASIQNHFPIKKALADRIHPPFQTHVFHLEPSKMEIEHTEVYPKHQSPKILIKNTVRNP